ncbi:autotransporter outer membrane beta-barrel domain-containing protein, partial [Phenylobacterium sp.]|uniref:autotransporter outer membrane beta-barrel domain-containing protein n=1 Tax=Phenylobacterium sp. TaxID=1871053 RepID=UPI002FDB8A0E
PTPPPVIDDGSITVRNPDGSTVRLTVPEQQLISVAEADQLVMALIGDRVQIGSLQTFVTERLRAIGTAALQANLRQFSDSGRYRGASAGEGAAGGGLWINVTGAYLEDKRRGAAQDGHSGALAIGVDRVMGSTILGAYVGHSRTELDGAGVAYESEGWNGGLYASLSPAPALRVTAAAGYGDYDVSHDRALGGVRSIGKTGRTQTHGSISVESPQALGDSWVVIPSVALAVSSSETDAYQDQANRPVAGNATDMTLISGGASLFYTGGAWLPFVSASFNHQTNAPAGTDPDYGLLGAGLAIPVGERLSLAITGQALVGKSREGQTTFGLTLRRAF